MFILSSDDDDDVLFPLLSVAGVGVVDDEPAKFSFSLRIGLVSFVGEIFFMLVLTLLALAKQVLVESLLVLAPLLQTLELSLALPITDTGLSLANNCCVCRGG